MNVQRPKVPPKLLLLLNTNVFEVLVPEDHDATLGNEKGQLVLLEVVELRELQAADLSTNDGSELGDLEVWVLLGVEEIGLGLVGD